MKPALVIKGWGAGVIKDQLPSELAPGFCSDCQNMRFRAGQAERMGGIASVITPSVIPYALIPYSSGAIKYLAYAGTAKVYMHDGSTETEITRGPALATSISMAGDGVTSVGTATTSSAHGLTTGDKLTFYGWNEDFLSLTAQVITVTGATTFTFPTANPFNGPYTEGHYTVVSSSGARNNFTGSVDDKWTGGNFNGVLFLNNPVDGAYYLDQTTDNRLHSFSDTVPVSDAARSFKNYIFLLAPTIAGVKYRHQILWGAAAEPGSVPVDFTASDTNDAGEVDQVSDGGCVDGLAWGEYFFLYKRDRRVRVSYIGGNDVFDFQQVQGDGDDGALAANCIANTAKGQVYLTNGKDIRIHNGGQSKSLANGRVYEWLRNHIDTTYQKRSFLAVNQIKQEVWICFPETGQTTCTKALVWNWEEDTWGFRSLSNVTCGADGLLPDSIATSSRLVVGNSTPKIGLVDSGWTDFDAAYTSMLERTGIDVDTPDYKVLTASFPRFNASTTGWTASIYHGSAPTPNGTVTYTTAQTYTHPTTRLITAITSGGPYLAVKFTTTASDQIELRTWELYVKKGARF